MNLPPASGKGKILIMDDEEIILEVAGEILVHLGYKVEFCREGSEAIAKYKVAGKTGEPFDAVLLDLTIPGGMGGKETMKRLLELTPTQRGLFPAATPTTLFSPITVNTASAASC